MPKVVTFSVFFPSLSSSSAVWAHPNAHPEQSNTAIIFFMIAPFERAIVCSRSNARNAVAVRCPRPAQSRLLPEERSSQRCEFLRGVPLDEMLAAVSEMQVEHGVEPDRERGAFRGIAAVLSSVDKTQGHRHFAQAFPQRLRVGFSFLRAAARARALEEGLEILSRAHAVAHPQHGRRDQAV